MARYQGWDAPVPENRRRHTWLKGEWTDDFLFGLPADDWRGATPAPR
ncbi:hypothetical protein [Amycolatopsis sp. NPDC051061]